MEIMRFIQPATRVPRLTHLTGSISFGALAASLVFIVLVTGISYFLVFGLGADPLSNHDVSAMTEQPSPARYEIVSTLSENHIQNPKPLPVVKAKIEEALDTIHSSRIDTPPKIQSAVSSVNQTDSGHGVLEKRIKNGVGFATPSPTHPLSLFVHVPVGRVRQEASKNAAIKSLLYKGERVDIIVEKGAWFQIHTEDGRDGWAHRILFSKAPSPPAEKKKKRIKAIRTKNLTDEGVEILIELDDYCLPQTSVISGERPRVVCDFYGLQPALKLKKRIEVNRGIIRSIRLGRHFEERAKTRVVIDLLPHQKYVVDQQFLIEENTYLLSIHP